MNVSNFKVSLSLLRHAAHKNRFIVNNELFEIDPVFINNLIKINNLNEINSNLLQAGQSKHKSIKKERVGEFRSACC